MTIKEIAITLKDHITNEEKMYDYFKEELKEIKENVKFTNGKVAEVMKDQSEFKAWKAYITGAIAVLTTVLVPISLLVINKLLLK